jgi:hypothetical protein
MVEKSLMINHHEARLPQRRTTMEKARRWAAIGSAAALGAIVSTSEASSYQSAISPVTKPGLDFVGIDIDVRTPDKESVDQQLDEIAAAGFNTVDFVTTWAIDQHSAYGDVEYIQYGAEQARARGLEPMLTFTPCWQSDNCKAPTSQEQKMFVTTLSHYAQVLDIKYWIIGNEPNSETFWDLQYSKSGESLAPASYYHLLAKSYDELKKQSPDNIVMCGALSSTGDDDPTKKKQSHSVAAFVKGMAAEYKESGRQEPFCDVLAFHPYLAGALEPPETVHPGGRTVSFAEYKELIALWDNEFKGTGQPRVPIYYSEFGIESQVPKRIESSYSNTQGERLDDKTRAEYTNKALWLASCQPRVIGFNNFLWNDDQDQAGMQTGFEYKNGQQKAYSFEIYNYVADSLAGNVEC